MAAKGRRTPGFLKLLLSATSVCLCAYVCVRMCVSAPEAINYVHVIFNLYNQLDKFVAFRNVTKLLCMGVAFVAKHVVTENNVCVRPRGYK